MTTGPRGQQLMQEKEGRGGGGAEGAAPPRSAGADCRPPGTPTRTWGAAASADERRGSTLRMLGEGGVVPASMKLRVSACKGAQRPRA